MMSNDIQERITKLPPWARGIFGEFVQELYDRESGMTMGFLEESRAELRGELTTIRSEQEELRGGSLPTLSARRPRHPVDHRSASLVRQGVSPDKLQRYLQRKLADKAPRGDSRSSMTSSMSYMSEASLNFDSRPSTSVSRASTIYTEEAVTPRVTPRKVSPAPATPKSPRKVSPAPATPKSHAEVSPAPATPKSPAEVSPAPATPKSPVEVKPELSSDTEKKHMQETEALLGEAVEAEKRQDSERERQWDKVRRAKERRKQRHQAQAELAAQMLDLAREVADAQNKEKEKQEQKIKERLEEMRKKKEAYEQAA